MGTTVREYLTMEELAAKYRVPLNTIKLWRVKGYGPRGVRIGRHVLYSDLEVERFDREVDEKATETPLRA